jgi:hypothetical protein
MPFGYPFTENVCALRAQAMPPARKLTGDRECLRLRHFCPLRTTSEPSFSHTDEAYSI